MHVNLPLLLTAGIPSLAALPARDVAKLKEAGVKAVHAKMIMTNIAEVAVGPPPPPAPHSLAWSNVTPGGTTND